MHIGRQLSGFTWADEESYPIGEIIAILGDTQRKQNSLQISEFKKLRVPLGARRESAGGLEQAAMCAICIWT